MANNVIELEGAALAAAIEYDQIDAELRAKLKKLGDEHAAATEKLAMDWRKRRALIVLRIAAECNLDMNDLMGESQNKSVLVMQTASGEARAFILLGGDHVPVADRPNVLLN